MRKIPSDRQDLRTGENDMPIPGSSVNITNNSISHYRNVSIVLVIPRHTCSKKFYQRGSKSEYVCLFDFFLITCVDEGREDQKHTIIGPPAKRHLISLAGRWRPNIECWLDNFVIFSKSDPHQYG